MLHICFHERAQHIFDTETADKLISEVPKKINHFKAPTYFILSLIRPEIIEPKKLIKKISSFDCASP